MALVSYALGALVLWWHMWPGASSSILIPALPTRPGRIVLDDRQTSQAGLAVPAAASAGHAEQCTGILLLVGDGTTAAHTPRTRLGAAATACRALTQAALHDAADDGLVDVRPEVGEVGRRRLVVCGECREGRVDALWPEKIG